MRQNPEILEDVQMESLNTLRVSARARFFVEVESAAELAWSLEWAAKGPHKTLILGGGSNLVFAGDFRGLVVRMAIRGRSWERVVDHRALQAPLRFRTLAPMGLNYVTAWNRSRHWIVPPVSWLPSAMPSAASPIAIACSGTPPVVS